MLIYGRSNLIYEIYYSKAPHSWGFLFVGCWVDCAVDKPSELEFEELVKELDDFSDDPWEELNDIVAMVPGALEKLKSMDGEYEKLYYYGELMEIARKLEEFKKGKEAPN